MKPQYPRNSQRRGRGPRRPSDRPRQEARSSSPSTPTKLSFWQRLKAFFGGSSKAGQSKSKPSQAKSSQAKPAQQGRSSRQPESVEVTSAKLYVGNLSFDAAESDLSELFNGVGAVRSTEIVTNKYNEKSKGFGFVTMSSIDEARRAVVELHDKEFLGRKLVVSGAKSSEREPNYRG